MVVNTNIIQFHLMLLVTATYIRPKLIVISDASMLLYQLPYPFLIWVIWICCRTGRQYAKLERKDFVSQPSMGAMLPKEGPPQLICSLQLWYLKHLIKRCLRDSQEDLWCGSGKGLHQEEEAAKRLSIHRICARNLLLSFSCYTSSSTLMSSYFGRGSQPPTLGRSWGRWLSGGRKSILCRQQSTCGKLALTCEFPFSFAI